MAATMSDLLTAVSTTNDSLDKLIAAEGSPSATDFQPAVDAVNALNDKIVAATPAPAS